jgi:transcriptional regulator with XRE-family HTH domain
MSDHTRENLLRLMAAGGHSIHALAKQAGLDERTIRGILNRGNKPHIRTLRRLADGLGVKVDELFLDPTQLLYRRFDRHTNPLVAEVIETHKELFDGWTEGEFDELHSRVGEGGALTREGVLAMARQTNRKRDLHNKLELLLESSQAEVIEGIVDLLYEKVELTAHSPK